MESFKKLNLREDMSDRLEKSLDLGQDMANRVNEMLAGEERGDDLDPNWVEHSFKQAYEEVRGRKFDSHEEQVETGARMAYELIMDNPVYISNQNPH
jgi:hypothetical protein